MDMQARIPTDVYVPKESLWNKLPIVALIFGSMCLVFWATTAKANLERAVFSYHFGFICVLSIALGCMIFVLIQHVTRAGWSVLVRRVAENGMMGIFVLALLFLPIVYFASSLFSWSHVDPTDKMLVEKAPYLNMTFFYIRAGIYFVIWMGTAWWFYRTSTALDDGGDREKVRHMWGLSAPAILFYALTVTFASVDWIMSLQPHWYSTIFGVYFFAGAMLSALSFIALVCMLLQNTGLMREVTAEHYHDLGKLMFGFTVFWAYIGFSQFMLYWYAGIPEEMEFFSHRLDHGWETITWLLPVSNFAIPFFFLMSRHVKRNRTAFAAGCIWVMVVHFVDLFWLILPNYGVHGEGHGGIPHMSVTAGDIACLLGMLSLFGGAVSMLLVRRSVVPIGDPRIQESLAFENF